MTDAADASGAGDATETSPAAPRRMARLGLSVTSALLALVIVVANFTVTDDAWPLAPLRMFSYGNKPDGQVHRMRFMVDWGDGERQAHSADFGLRRSELEEQTPWRQQVPPAKLRVFVDHWNERHPDRQLQHFQVVVVTTRMRDSRPVGDESITVIGDWAAPEFTGERADVDLPMAPDVWPGHGT